MSDTQEDGGEDSAATERADLARKAHDRIDSARDVVEESRVHEQEDTDHHD
jgi:hypothetical protein